MIRLLYAPLMILSLACTPEATPDVTPETPEAETVATVKTLAGELVQGEKRLRVGDSAVLDTTLELESGTAELDLPGVGTVRLYPKTKFQLAGKRRTRLLAGKLWATIAGSEAGFAVETDNAVCGVRGTEFVVARVGVRTRVAVAKGKVAVANKKVPEKEVLVNAGEEVEVNQDAPPTEKKTFDPAPERAAWSAAAEQVQADTPSPEAPRGPVPGVRSDREAMEKVEKQGREDKEKLEKEDQREKQKLDAEEKKNREVFEKGQKELEKELEKDMGINKRIAPKKGSLKHESIKEDGKSDEMKDFLK